MAELTPNIEELTPMMQQYMKTKEEYKDCILFYRLGDFYEVFEDAVTVSKELELTLTGKKLRPQRAGAHVRRPLSRCRRVPQPSGLQGL